MRWRIGEYLHRSVWFDHSVSVTVGNVVRHSQHPVGIDVAVTTVCDSIGSSRLVMELTVGSHLVAKLVGTCGRNKWNMLKIGKR